MYQCVVFWFVLSFDADVSTLSAVNVTQNPTGCTRTSGRFNNNNDALLVVLS